MPGQSVVTDVLVREGDRLLLRGQAIELEVVSGPSVGQVTRLWAPEIRIGSGTGCQLVLLDPAASRHHLSLRMERGEVRVIDADSSNGTVLDGVRIRDAWARDGSIIELGNSRLRVKLTVDTVSLPMSTRERFGEMLGVSPPMRVLFTALERISPTDETVLIEGETGTGKELCAEAIHDESPRSSGPFVVFDCSAVAPTLIESELFGHTRGAFTGALADRVGAFEAADRGTLFLDEIGELPLDLQPRLLRALEQREVRRVGSTETRRVDVRVVAATHRNLANEVSRGSFREDLFYRLAVVQVRIPPLRERSEDIPLIAAHLAQLSGGRPLDAATLARFQRQAWPGNVRELRNAVARTLALGAPGAAPQTRSVVSDPTRVDLSVPLRAASTQVRDAFEAAWLREALKSTQGNVTRAAELAGVNRKYLQRAMKRLGLERSD